MKRAIPQFIILGFLILAGACCLAWLDTSVFEPKRLPPCVQEKMPKGRICLDYLLRHWNNKTLWIDARSQNDFEINHLRLTENNMFQIQPGSQMSQQIDAAIGRLLECEENKECIVIFCTAECSKAEEVKKELIDLDLGEVPIFILEGGWDAIKKDGTLIR